MADRAASILRPVCEWGLDPMSTSHVRLFVADLLSLQPVPQLPGCFSRKGRPVFKAEVLGVVVSVDRKERFLRFVLDDGTGVLPCILWLNHSTSRFFTSMKPSLVEAKAEIAGEEAEQVKLGRLVRAQGRITCFNQQLQLTVYSLQVEIDANAEVLHWLDCIRLAVSCYCSPPPSLSAGQAGVGSSRNIFFDNNQ